MNRNIFRKLPMALAMTLLPLAAKAHPGHGEEGFHAGWGHPAVSSGELAGTALLVLAIVALSVAWQGRKP